MKIINAIILVLFFVGCMPDNQSKYQFQIKDQKLKWIEGNFIYTDEEGYYFENWKRKNNTELIGEGYYFHSESKDTIFKISMFLKTKREKTTMNYVTSTKHGVKTSEFVLTKSEPNFFVFENPHRGFPSIMQYKFTGDSLINIHQYGFIDDKKRDRKYGLHRVY